MTKPMADALKAHVAQCPEHPMAALLALLQRVYLHAKMGTALEADVRETLRALNALPNPDAPAART